MKAIKQLLVIGIFGLLIAGAVSVSGYFSPARKKLIGQWNISFEMTQSDLQQLGVTSNPLAATAQTLMKSMQAEMKVEFLDDDTIKFDMSTFGFLVGDSGKWEVAGRDGDLIIVRTSFPGDEQPKEWKLQFLDEDTFQMASPQDSRFPLNQMLTFRRAKAKPS